MPRKHEEHEAEGRPQIAQMAQTCGARAADQGGRIFCVRFGVRESSNENKDEVKMQKAKCKGQNGGRTADGRRRGEAASDQ